MYEVKNLKVLKHATINGVCDVSGNLNVNGTNILGTINNHTSTIKSHADSIATLITSNSNANILLNPEVVALLNNPVLIPIITYLSTLQPETVQTFINALQTNNETSSQMFNLLMYILQNNNQTTQFFLSILQTFFEVGPLSNMGQDQFDQLQAQLNIIIFNIPSLINVLYNLIPPHGP